MATTLLVATIAGASPQHAADTLAEWIRTDWGPRQDDVQTDVLVVPREYAEATNQVRARLRADPPDLFVLLDTDATSPEWKLHVFAANYDDDAEPDAAGVVHRDHIIDPEGPVAYRSRLPLDGLWDKFLVERVPTRMSHKAGGHVFNHVFYRAMHDIARSGLPTLGGALETPPLGGRDGRSRAQLIDETAMVLAVLVDLYPAALKQAGSPESPGTP